MFALPSSWQLLSRLILRSQYLTPNNDSCLLNSVSILIYDADARTINPNHTLRRSIYFCSSSLMALRRWITLPCTPCCIVFIFVLWVTCFSLLYQPGCDSWLHARRRPCFADPEAQVVPEYSFPSSGRLFHLSSRLLMMLCSPRPCSDESLFYGCYTDWMRSRFFTRAVSCTSPNRLRSFLCWEKRKTGKVRR